MAAAAFRSDDDDNEDDDVMPDLVTRQVLPALENLPYADDTDEGQQSCGEMPELLSCSSDNDDDDECGSLPEFEERTERLCDDNSDRDSDNDDDEMPALEDLAASKRRFSCE